MKIWIVEIGEPLPLEPNVRLHLCGLYSRWLAAHGHDVTWWTSSFSHAPKKHFAQQDCTVVHSGVRLKVIRGPGYRRNVSLARIRHQAHFAGEFFSQGQAAIRRGDRPDILLAGVPTIEGAEAAVRLAREHGIPVVAEIRDLWPDELKNLAPKPLRGLAGLLLSGAYRKMRYVCSQATALAGVSRTYLDYGLKQAGRTSSALDFVFPLGYAKPDISPDDLAKARAWIASLSIPATALVSCFFGTIGRYFDLDMVIEAARELGPDYHFVLGGAGSSLADYRKKARGLPNVVFPGWLDGGQIQAVMEISHVGLAPYGANAQMSLPNKPFEYMSAGLPIVSTIAKELQDILKAAHAGFTIPAGSAEQLASTLRRLKGDSNLREATSRNARAAFEREFSTEVIFSRTTAKLAEIVAMRCSADLDII